jgi:hypothetical protein
MSVTFKGCHLTTWLESFAALSAMTYQTKPTSNGVYRIKVLDQDLVIESTPGYNPGLKLAAPSDSNNKQKVRHLDTPYLAVFLTPIFSGNFHRYQGKVMSGRWSASKTSLVSPTSRLRTPTGGMDILIPSLVPPSIGLYWNGLSMVKPSRSLCQTLPYPGS